MRAQISIKDLQIAVAGGFGHATCVFDELSQADHTLQACAIAPAYADESLEAFKAYPFVRAASVFDSLDALFKAKTPDVVIVSTEPYQIQPTIIRALEAGCHVIAEKPIALSMEDLLAVREALIKSGKSLMAMLSMRTLPAFIEARKQVALGAIGDLLLANTRKSYKWGTRAPWFNDPLKYGGTWPWIGIHNFDMAHFVTGKHARKVVAHHANRSHPDMPNCEDLGMGLAIAEDGFSMTLSIDLCRPDKAPTWGDDWIRVVGSKGIIEAHASRGKLLLTGEDGSVVETGLSTDFEPIYLPFLTDLDGDRRADAETALQLTASALSARESAIHGSQIEIPSLAIV